MRTAPAWLAFPLLPLLFTAAFSAFLLVPPVRGHVVLTTTFGTVALLLLAWQITLGLHARRSGRRLGLELPVPVKSHYIQACCQFSIYLAWGSSWRPVYLMLPLVFAQLLCFYLVDALLSWSRGRSWRLGFGPFPIVLSMNLFIWFKVDWFYLQFVLLLACALGKEFLRWNRDGRDTHIFNPAAFGLFLASIALLVTGTTQATWGVEIASTLKTAPQIYVHIFLLGIIVQYFFAVTLLTFSAAAILVLLNLAFTGWTGTYHFIDTNIPIGVFLGLHLLMTDPATTPRTPLGRVLFGALYGIGTFASYELLGQFHVPDFYDKLLVVPFLNLAVTGLDAVARHGLLGRLGALEARFDARRRNLLYMGGWATLFAWMFFTGFVQAPHQGASIPFWRQAVAEGKPAAERKLLKLVGARADAGSPQAINLLGELHLEGRITERNVPRAASCFAQACALGNSRACGNLVRQFLLHGGPDPDGAATRMLMRLAREPTLVPDADFLLGFAHESGRGGLGVDRDHALDCYRSALRRGHLDAAKGLIRLLVSGLGSAADARAASVILETSCGAGDVQSCHYLAYLHHAGLGVLQDDQRAMAMLARAAELGSTSARNALAGMVDWAGFRPNVGAILTQTP